MPGEPARDNPEGPTADRIRSPRPSVPEDKAGAGPRGNLRDKISTAFTWVEDVVYVGLGLLLAGSALFLLATGALSFGRDFLAGTLAAHMVDYLDRTLLILMIIEILYTVQVSFREHSLIPEPFLIVGLIATTRRILVLTAEFARLPDKGEALFRNAMLELGLLTLLIVALVASLIMLRKWPLPSKFQRAGRPPQE